MAETLLPTESNPDHAILRSLGVTVRVEEWRPVVGYEGLYEVSSAGRVRSLAGRSKAPWIMAPGCVSGYQNVGIFKNDVRTNHSIHRLVAAAFIGPIPPKFQVNHLNGVKWDNRVKNLEIVTCSQNHRHSFDVLGKKNVCGEKHWRAKLTDAQVGVIRSYLEAGDLTHKQIAELMGCSRQMVSNISSGSRRTPKAE